MTDMGILIVVFVAVPILAALAGLLVWIEAEHEKQRLALVDYQDAVFARLLEVLKNE